MRTHTVEVRTEYNPLWREIVLNDDGTLATSGGFRMPGRTVWPIGQLLWLDAFENGPWTPSAIDEVVLKREHGSISYRRAS
jgi:hypothetical protein